MTTTVVDIKRFDQASAQELSDTLAVEEPLEIRIDKKTISITMRTPGNDFELAVGFLYTEGILRDTSDLIDVTFCGPSKNVVKVVLNPGANFNIKNLERHFYTSSSCGVCGKTSIEALRVQAAQCLPATGATPKVSGKIIHHLPEKLRQAQKIFDTTGGLHGCALFNENGDLLSLREDVGRHNALDKLIGFYFLENKLPLHRSLRSGILLVSGRASFELVQKAHMAGIGIFAAVGAPSSLAVELAIESGMTLLGFVRNERFNIYSGRERITS
jgi:FdhD protein